MKKPDASYIRENMPECVAFADMIREQFGDGVKMIYAKENGLEFGKQTTGDCVHSLADIDLTPIRDNSRGRREK